MFLKVAEVWEANNMAKLHCPPLLCCRRVTEKFVPMPCEGHLFPLMRAAAFIIRLLCPHAAPAPLVLVVGIGNHDWQDDACW